MTVLSDKPYAPACERNQEPIRAALARILTEPATVLEIGSGTGQHGVYFATHLPHLHWQLTDVADNVPGIRLWQSEAALPNLPAPRVLDVLAPVDLDMPFDDHRDTSEGNAALAEWLQSRDPDAGIKDLAEFEAVAGDYGLEPVAVHAMPANNQLLQLRMG